MYRKIFDKPLDELTEADIFSLVERSVPEGPHLDYKRELGAKDGKSKDWNKELAKDVAAFANAYGGYLVYGVDEKKGGRRRGGGDRDRGPSDRGSRPAPHRH